MLDADQAHESFMAGDGPVIGRRQLEQIDVSLPGLLATDTSSSRSAV
jgi:hypothetical protein